MCDVVVDGPFIKEKKDLSLRFRGSKNQRLIDVKETLKQEKIMDNNNIEVYVIPEYYFKDEIVEVTE